MYNYNTQKSRIFEEKNQEMFLSIRDRVNHLLREAGAARMSEIISGQTGDNWDIIACVDRLAELKEIKEVKQENVRVEYRIFVFTGV